MPTKTSSSVPAKPKILVIRRDNIGDLILTTPLIHALRQRFPQAWIGALVNSYNARVLEANPDLDEVFVYTKAKHRGSASVWSAYWSTFRLIFRLRKLRVDYAIRCFFGNSDARQWHPWGVPYQLIQPKSEDVADIPVTQALDKFRELQTDLHSLEQAKILT